MFLTCYRLSLCLFREWCGTLSLLHAGSRAGHVAGGTDRLQKPLGSCVSFTFMVFIVKSQHTSLSLSADQERKCQRLLSLLLFILPLQELGAGLGPPCLGVRRSCSNGTPPMGQTHRYYGNPIPSPSPPSAQPCPFKPTP